MVNNCLTHKVNDERYVSNDRKNYTSQAIFNRNFRYRDVDLLRALLEEEIVTVDWISLDRINFNSGNESLTLLLTFNITSSRNFSLIP